MNALFLLAKGRTENFELRNVEIPSPGTNEILIRTHAISINPIDVKTRKGAGLYEKFSGCLPLILGWDAAGTVEKVGRNVSEFAVGDRVFGMINFPGLGKCYAEYVTAPAHQMAKIPDCINFAHAAAACLAALTAWQALTVHSRVNNNSHVLIHGASGGVGHFAVQMAKYLGAVVTGTCSATHHDFVKSLGANHCVDYSMQNWSGFEQKFDIIIDPIGGENIHNSLLVAKNGATLISLPSSHNQHVEAEAASFGVVGKKFIVESHGEQMRQIADLLNQKHISPFISSTFTGLEQIPLAHLQVETGHTKGKVVVMLS